MDDPIRDVPGNSDERKLGQTIDVDRRRAVRHSVEGEAFLYLDASYGPSPVVAHLVDVSSTGFRATHDVPTLRAGDEVCFRHAFASGVARVVWTCADGQSSMSGFLIIKDWARTESGPPTEHNQDH